jgi:hypothetical protein
MQRRYDIVRRDKPGLDAIKVPTNLDVAWAAGIYEGEGSCVCPNVNGSHSFGVQVSQKDPELLYKMRDMFGGSVKPYMNGGFSIYHLKICGDRGRVFLATIYPYLTVRRKAQIDATRVKLFLNECTDIVNTPRESQECPIYAALWVRVGEYVEQQRKKAKNHRTEYQDKFYADRSKNPEWMEKRRLATAKWRAEKKSKEQLLNVVEFKKIA